MRNVIVRLLVLLFCAVWLSVVTGCTVTPSMHAGLSLERSNGNWSVSSRASVGITGRP